MSVKADTKYNGVVAPQSQLYETQTGTLGYQVMLECADGATSAVMAGWRVLHFTPRQVTSGQAVQAIEAMLKAVR